MKKRRAEDVINENISSWGEGRSKYEVSIKDLRILLKAGARKVFLDRDNGDGTFYSNVTLDGHVFACSSKEQV